MHSHIARSMAESIVHANSYRESHQKAGGSTATAMTIAVSRQAGAGGTSVAAEVGRRLGWPVYDHALVERIAQEMHLRTRLLESVDEKRMHWLAECAESFTQVPLVSESAYVRHLIHTILSLGTHGACVIVGRGASHILPPASTLRVRLVASREDRLANLAREQGVPEAEVARRIDAIDQERISFIKDHFLRDPRDAQNFDLVLNSSRFTYPECADLIIEALGRMKSRSATA